MSLIGVETKEGIDNMSSVTLPQDMDSKRISLYSDASLFLEDEEDDLSYDSDKPVIKRPKGPLGGFRYWCGRIVNDGYVQTTVLCLIIVNAIMMAIATFEIVWGNPSTLDTFAKVDKSFLIIFTIESALQFIYHGIYLFTDGWLAFDLIIVVLSWSLSSMQVIRSFRIFRALRLITKVEALKTLVTALFDVIPNLSAIACLLLLIFYIFAVMFTTLFKDLDLEEPYFARLDNSFFTLFQVMTMDWHQICRECMVHHPWAWLPFVVFVIVSSFVVFNLIVGVLCEALSLLEAKRVGDLKKRELELLEKKMEKTKKRLEKVDSQVASLVSNQTKIQETLDELCLLVVVLPGISDPFTSSQ